MNFLTVLLLTALSYFIFRYILPNIRSWENEYRAVYISHTGALLLSFIMFCVLCLRMYYDHTQEQAKLEKAAEIAEQGQELQRLRQELDTLLIDTPQGKQRLKEINKRLQAIQK
jgi:hypothetical protein